MKSSRNSNVTKFSSLDVNGAATMAADLQRSFQTIIRGGNEIHKHFNAEEVCKSFFDSTLHRDDMHKSVTNFMQRHGKLMHTL